MGRVDAFQIDGCRSWFWSRDHGPAHFHVSSAGEWEILVYFLSDPVAYEVEFELKKIPRRTLLAILNAAAEHREQLLHEWSQKTVRE